MNSKSVSLIYESQKSLVQKLSLRLVYKQLTSAKMTTKSKSRGFSSLHSPILYKQVLQACYIIN